MYILLFIRDCAYRSLQRALPHTLVACRHSEDFPLTRVPWSRLPVLCVQNLPQDAGAMAGPEGSRDSTVSGRAAASFEWFRHSRMAHPFDALITTPTGRVIVDADRIAHQAKRTTFTLLKDGPAGERKAD